MSSHTSTHQVQHRPSSTSESWSSMDPGLASETAQRTFCSAPTTNCSSIRHTAMLRNAVTCSTQNTNINENMNSTTGLHIPFPVCFCKESRQSNPGDGTRLQCESRPVDLASTRRRSHCHQRAEGVRMSGFSRHKQPLPSEHPPGTLVREPSTMVRRRITHPPPLPSPFSAHATPHTTRLTSA